MTPVLDADAGQATVELVALLPVVVALALIVAQLLAVGQAREQAGAASRAGAIAVLQGEDAVAAARAAVPGRKARDVRVHVDAGKVVVTVDPRVVIPGLAGALAPRVTADAGSAS